MRDIAYPRQLALEYAATLALSFLEERERRMVVAYYWRYGNTDLVGEKFGISGQRVRQIWPRIHNKMLFGMMSCGVGQNILEILRG